jgi:hypothetical protein
MPSAGRPAVDGAVSAGQRVARLIRPDKVRDVLHGVWLGHPLHPVLVQVTTGAWLSASILDFTSADDRAARRLAAVGIGTAVPGALAGAADWSEQHEQQMRVGVIHAAGNLLAVGLYAASLARRGPRADPGLPARRRLGTEHRSRVVEDAARGCGHCGSRKGR